jgi:hypothetical protein
LATCSLRMRKISCCCSFAAGDPDPLLPVFRAAKSIGVEPALFGARGSAPASMRALTAAAQRLRTARCNGATPLLSRAFGSAPARMSSAMITVCSSGFQRARPSIDSIMKRLCTTPVLRTSVRAPGDQLLYNAGLFCRRTRMQCGIALADVVLDSIEKILLCSLSRCATSRVLSCEVRRSIKQPDSHRNVTRDDDFHERSEGIDLFVNGFHFSPQRASKSYLTGADYMRLSQSIFGRVPLLLRQPPTLLRRACL